MMQIIKAFSSHKIHEYIIAHEPVEPERTVDLESHGSHNIRCRLDRRHLLVQLPNITRICPKKY